MKTLLLCFVAALVISPVYGQTLRAWTFDSEADLPEDLRNRWVGDGGVIRVDSTTKAEGFASVLFDCPEDNCGLRYRLAGIDSLQGSALRLTARFRTDFPEETGPVYLMMMSSDGTRLIKRAQNWSNGMTTSTDWMEMSIQVPIDAPANQISIIIDSQGRGRTWLDDGRLSVIPWGRSEQLLDWAEARFNFWTGTWYGWLRLLLTYFALPFALLAAAMLPKRKELIPVSSWAHRWLGVVLVTLTGPFLTWVLPEWASGPFEGGAYWDFVVYSLLAGSAMTAVWWKRRSQIDEVQLWRNMGLALRYFLAAIFVGYAMAKFYENQLQPISNTVLNMRVGDLTPMQLLWNYFGYSFPYVVFIGASQLIGAFLLLFRKTYILGAMVLTAVVTNIVFVNYAYDIPVKFPSTVFLLMILFLLLEETPRLWSGIVLRKDSLPAVSPYRPVWRNHTGTALAVIFMLLIVWKEYAGIQRSQQEYDAVTFEEPLSRVWTVADRSPADTLETPATGWDKLIIEDTWASVERHGTRERFLAVDFADSLNSFQMMWQDSTDAYAGVWELDADTLILRGTQFGDSVVVRLHKRHFRLKPER